MNPNPTKKFSWKWGLALFVAVGLIAGCASIVFQAKSETLVQGSIAAEPSSVVTTTPIVAAVGLGSSFSEPGLPVRLTIPAIGVDAAIQSVGIAWNAPGEMGIPTNFTDVGWYNGGPRPGVPGSAVIDGHLDGKYTPRAVFYDLGKLVPGDLVNVTDKNGNTFQFSVVAVKTYDYNASTSDIFSSSDSVAHLNLITCTGDWIKSQKLYNKRVVVFTDLVTAN
jgi:sortase (surface protein transpeptidase)